MTCPRIGCGGRLLLADIITREGEMMAFRCSACGNYLSGQILLNRVAPPVLPERPVKRWGISRVKTRPEPTSADLEPQFDYVTGGE